MNNKFFIKYNSVLYESHPYCVVDNEHLPDNTPAVSVAVGFEEILMPLYDENGEITYNTYSEILPCLSFGIIIGSDGSEREQADTSDLEEALTYHDGRYIIPAIDFSYSQSLFDSTLTGAEEIILSVSKIIKSQDNLPVVCLGLESEFLSYTLEQEDILFIDSSF